ncbi:helix-turn-helix domain-containing protein [Aquirufa novilacunae]|jgi:excisionase family DNA binding protein|uniref:Helix-turn-helix domain-containing protein n=1 Tax=Aquirufa novilacunae TaxID=3139305 RepID=A0ABW8U0C1_9BACT
MEIEEKLIRPTKEEQKIAKESYLALSSTLELLHSVNPEIEIEETEEKIKVPLKALKLLATILKATSQGKPISIVPIATEMTTQAASEMLGCSRPHLISLLENGEIPFIKVGKHRRIKYEDVIKYKDQMYSKQRERITEMMKMDEDLGLYDS